MVLILLMQLLVCIIGKVIVYEFDANARNQDYWVADLLSSFLQCNSQYILKPNSMNYALMRNFELPPHYRIYIDLTFYRIDSWDNDKFQIYLDNQLLFEQAYSHTTGTSNLCGDATYNDEIIQISLQAQHNSNFAVILLQALDVNSHINENWGIKSFTLSIDACPQGCDYCESNSYQYCRYWSLQYWDQQLFHYFYYKYYLYQVHYCNQLCQYTITLPQHNKVMIRFRIYVPGSYTQNINILINNQIYSSKSLSNTLSYQQLIDFTLPFFNHIENKINVQIQRIEGYDWLYIKDFQLLIQKNDEQHQFILGCMNIIQNTCWECEYGWILVNEQQINQEQRIILNSLEQQCIPNCGDKLIVGSEQCDDGNSNPYDGCYNCQYQCAINCFKCIFGVCQQCESGYYLNINKICLQIEEDSIIFLQLEYQNDQYLQIRGIQCQNKKIYQSLQFQQNNCIPICGDLIITNNEQCDDGNEIPFDGCYNCQFQCDSYCQFCNFGVCQQCFYGYQLNLNNNCQPICGDGFIIQLSPRKIILQGSNDI